MRTIYKRNAPKNTRYLDFEIKTRPLKEKLKTKVKLMIANGKKVDQVADELGITVKFAYWLWKN